MTVAPLEFEAIAARLPRDAQIAQWDRRTALAEAAADYHRDRAAGSTTSLSSRAAAARSSHFLTSAMSC